jgi:peptidoglycan/xylan/chitin deacetylase (PgdA/CDA1 family)
VKPPLHLTFDDGPHPENTPALLELLRAHRARASFFEIGRLVDRYPEITERAAADGHEVGNHTWDHVRLPEHESSVVREQLETTSAAIERATGRRPTLFRAPWLDLGSGSVREQLVAFVNELGMTVVGCDVDAEDYKRGSAEGIVHRVLDGARPHAVVMLHDDVDQTVPAVERVLAELVDDYSFEALAVRG